MKPIINFIFSIGYRCNSTDFLTNFKLRKMSSPFDYSFIDFETSLKIINTQFNDYCNDIILLNKNKQRIELFYKKHTSAIKNKFHTLLKNDVGYMAHNYNGHNLLFNQNYFDDSIEPDKNLYNWKTICCFYHHDISDSNTYYTIKKRCERFNNIINKYNQTTALFYITKIIHCENITDYMNNILEIKRKYGITCFIIIIITCNNIEDNHYYNEQDKCLFIIKKVENYKKQYAKYQTDNNLNYENEYNIILNYFTLELIEKNDD